jgi:hypothetical protein
MAMELSNMPQDFAGHRRGQGLAVAARLAALSGPRRAGMAKINYESEYDNRARVPEHPQISHNGNATPLPIAPR